MAKLYNLARMTTATVGTGTITLGAAVSGYLSFANAGVANADVVSYGIKDGSNSEVGTGTYTSAGTTLTRTVTKSTNSNAAISLSGTAEVFITPRAEDLGSAGQIPGTATNDNASAGNIGEYVESVIPFASAVSLTSGTPVNMTSISLTAGDWDVTLDVAYNPAATTNVTQLIHSISSTSGAQDFTTGGASTIIRYGSSGLVPTGNIGSFPVGTVRKSLSATATIFGVAQASFTVSTCSTYGILRARRVR